MIFLDPNLVPGSGSYVLSLKSEELAFDTKWLFLMEKYFSIPRIHAHYIKLKKTTAAVQNDSLYHMRMGYAIKKVPLTDIKSNDAGDNSLELRSYIKKETHTVKTGRNIEILVPSDYDDLYKLPVLYLLHGGGDSETAWRTKGYIIDTLNSFKDRKIHRR
jgi:hypothetical protein